jgi:tyrosyl-tRNA synthetase
MTPDTLYAHALTVALSDADLREIEALISSDAGDRFTARKLAQAMAAREYAARADAESVEMYRNAYHEEQRALVAEAKLNAALSKRLMAAYAVAVLMFLVAVGVCLGGAK